MAKIDSVHTFLWPITGGRVKLSAEIDLSGLDIEKDSLGRFKVEKLDMLKKALTDALSNWNIEIEKL